MASAGEEATSAPPACASVRVATYNVLSPNLCSPGYFRSCSPEACDPEARLSRVLVQLEAEEGRGRGVVALQEVALKWAGPLQAWFAQRGFAFIHNNYGSPFNGYMGVGLAYPLDKFELLDADICRLSDTKRWPREPEGDDYPGKRLLKALAPVGMAALAPVRWASRLVLGPPPREEEDPWEYSRKRFNGMVSARLRCKATGAAFWVSTYHMPCAFFSPPVMVIHTALAVQRVAALAKGEPHVLCGDFNIKPVDCTYRLITEGSIPEGHPELPQPRAWDKWEPKVKAPMKSAYAEVNGSEPDFTNYAQVKDQDPFIDCLDYIFISQHCRATSVRQLPRRGEVAGPYPTLAEPSDHVLIAAEIAIPKVGLGQKAEAANNPEASTAAAGPA